MSQVINFHCVLGGLWCVMESLFFSSKQTVVGMNGKYGCILVRFIIMINKWFTLTSGFLWNTPRWVLCQGEVCMAPVRCAAHRRKWMLMQHKWSLIQWCVWVLTVYCQGNERGWMLYIYKIHVSRRNVLSSRATTCVLSLLWRCSPFPVGRKCLEILQLGGFVLVLGSPI